MSREKKFFFDWMDPSLRGPNYRTADPQGFIRQKKNIKKRRKSNRQLRDSISVEAFRVFFFCLQREKREKRFSFFCFVLFHLIESKPNKNKRKLVSLSIYTPPFPFK